MIGHRGSPRSAPENTLSSFRQAYSEGVSWVEFDVVLSSDGVPIVFHDDTLDRTTNASGLVKAAPAAVLRGLDAGGWFDRVFLGEAIPTLAETLMLLSRLGMGFNIEFKQDAEREIETVGAAVALIDEIWREDLPTPLLSSFSRAALAAAFELKPRWPRSMLFEDLPSDWSACIREHDLSYIGLDDRYLTVETVQAVRQHGCGVMVYTVNDINRAASLRKWGVDSIFTDLPRLMLSISRR